ncbi:hypothetical protein SK128_016016 [Halocaridina rubra]|uniref:Very-long-chain (3R)-3-hydroxyacyl-CoA dehydratase n=1 Tax=Halocaridina rubra TaxID=373956 RepID=A0AAN9A539_HALRR
MEENKHLSPFVYWAQTDTTITLRIELRNVQNLYGNNSKNLSLQSPHVDLQRDSLSFTAVGNGAQGENNYSFHLKFLKEIDTEESRYRVLDRNVEFNLRKSEVEFWSRLLDDTKKPEWLKIDFDKWTHEEDLSDEARDIMEDHPGLFDQLQAEELGWPTKREDWKPFTRESMRKVYLFLYNLWQFVGFIYIVSVLTTRYLKEGPDSMEGTYAAVGWMIKMCFTTQFLEIFHPMVGYTKGSVFEAVVQIGGRSLIFFCLIEGEERMQTKPVIFYLFLIWSLIELVRYPYYMLRVYDLEIGFLTWLRYTIWIPLYPLGFICEGIVILSWLLQHRTMCAIYFSSVGNHGSTLVSNINLGND